MNFAHRIEERHKAIAIPVSFADGHPRFLTVRDRRFKDWIFVAGGCRKREVNNPIRCALRELEEETRGVMALKEGEYTTFSFRVHNRTDEELGDDSRRGVRVISVYHVFIFFVNMTAYERRVTIQRFNTEKMKMDGMKEKKLPIKRTHDENDMMLWETLEEFQKRKQWDVIRIHVLNNPQFGAKLHETRENFNVRRCYTYNASVSCNSRVEDPGDSDGRRPGGGGDAHGPFSKEVGCMDERTSGGRCGRGESSYKTTGVSFSDKVLSFL